MASPSHTKPTDRPLTSGRLNTLTGVQILSTGSYVPEDVVTNEDLAHLGCDADWIVQRTGIHQRRRAASDQATSDLAFEAAKRCLQQAEVSAEEVDMIIVATMTPDTAMPSTACHLQRLLGASSAAAVDMNAACSGFLYALATASQFIKTGCSHRALVVGAEVMSRVLDPTDVKTYPLFGDAAGAVLLGAGSEEQGLLGYTLGADGTGADLLCVPGGGSREPISEAVVAAKRQYLHMQGRQVFKWAVRTIADSMLDVLNHAQLTPANLDLLVLHQANARIIDAAVESLDFDRSKVVINLDQYGNTSAASVPLVLDEAHRQGRIQRGDNLLLCGVGGGLTWGTAVMKW